MKKYFCEFIENNSIAFGAEGYLADEVDQRIAELVEENRKIRHEVLAQLSVNADLEEYSRCDDARIAELEKDNKNHYVNYADPEIEPDRDCFEAYNWLNFEAYNWRKELYATQEKRIAELEKDNKNHCSDLMTTQIYMDLEDRIAELEAELKGEKFMVSVAEKALDYALATRVSYELLEYLRMTLWGSMDGGEAQVARLEEAEAILAMRKEGE